MSGVSLAVGARPDQPTATAGESTSSTKSGPKQPPPSQLQQQTMMGGLMGSLRVIELQLVAFIMVFSLSGLVPVLDLVFPLFISAYLIVLSRLVFPSPRGRGGATSEIFQGSRLFRLYVILGTAVGLFLPLAYVLGGFARGDNSAVRSATPHLFLLSCQILTENLVSGLSLFSPPIRALVPLMYTVRRVFVILDWTQDVWFQKTLAPNADIAEVGWYWFGKGLAAANLSYFSINLLCFLIPRFLPRAFEKYFNDRDNGEEMHSKMAEDKRSAAAKSQQPEKKSD
ncbi:unnamed protein product [Linum tenue]|uniref:DUF7733 domain-containing protein n=1 Tax=Linum tenue TaxID=586396 RepID=A0AAV0H9V9_9ROSI|nr:unnamed protein product [Linum tenue]